MTGLEKETLLGCVNIATQRDKLFDGCEREIPEGYNVSNTAERVVKLIAGTAKLTAHWKNMEPFSRYQW